MYSIIKFDTAEHKVVLPMEIELLGRANESFDDLPQPRYPYTQIYDFLGKWYEHKGLEKFHMPDLAFDSFEAIPEGADPELLHIAILSLEV